MAYLIGGNLLILIFLRIGLNRRVSLYSPLMLSALVWQVVFISGLLFGGMFFPLKDRAFVMWLIWFVVSSLFYLSLSARPQPRQESEFRRLPFDYTIILVVLNLWLAYQVWVVGNAGPTQFFFNLRLSSNDVGSYESLGLVGWFYPWVFALFLFEHVNARHGNRHLRRLLWCWMLLYALATMGKFALLTPVLAWSVIKGLRWELPFRRLLILVPSVFAIMVVLHLVRALSGEQIDFREYLSTYTYSPLVALGYMDASGSAQFGAHVFRFFYALVHAAVGGAEPVQVIQNYVAVPYLTNVYTVMQPFARDFGLIGVLFGAVAYGIFFGVIYSRAQANRPLALVLYAGLSVILIGQFIGEFLFTMFSGHLQFIIAAFLFTSEARSVDLDR